MFGNLPGLDVCEGDKVSWHLLGLGSEADVHGAVFQGNTIQINGMRRDSASLFPHTFVTAFMQPDNSGECFTADWADGQLSHYGRESGRWNLWQVLKHSVNSFRVSCATGAYCV